LELKSCHLSFLTKKYQKIEFDSEFLESFQLFKNLTSLNLIETNFFKTDLELIQIFKKLEKTNIESYKISNENIKFTSDVYKYFLEFLKRKQIINFEYEGCQYYIDFVLNVNQIINSNIISKKFNFYNINFIEFDFKFFYNKKYDIIYDC
jgi:hypothetical protein